MHSGSEVGRGAAAVRVRAWHGATVTVRVSSHSRLAVQKERILQDVEYIKSESYINLKRDLAETFKWFLVRSHRSPAGCCSSESCSALQRVRRCCAMAALLPTCLWSGSSRVHLRQSSASVSRRSDHRRAERGCRRSCWTRRRCT